MDKQSSVNCTKVTLIVTNLLSLLLGVSGFILGFARPNVLYFVSVSGLQVSVASLCLIASASLGLFAAITLNFHMLISYAALIISSFLLRIIWSITAYIHSTVLILDCSASTTILSTIASFFLMLFALLLANTSRNDDTTSKAKLINNNSKSISPIIGTQNSILKGSLNNDLKKTDKDKQKSILTSVNCISATPSPVSNQSSLTTPSSQQSLQQQQYQTRHHYNTNKSMTSNTSPTSHYNQQPPTTRSTSNKQQQQQRNRHKRTNTGLIV